VPPKGLLRIWQVYIPKAVLQALKGCTRIAIPVTNKQEILKLAYTGCALQYTFKPVFASNTPHVGYQMELLTSLLEKALIVLPFNEYQRRLRNLFRLEPICAH